MTPSSRAARFAAVACAALITATPTLAKGPLDVDVASPLILVKEEIKRIDVDQFPWALDDGRTEPLEVIISGDTVELPWVEVERDGDDVMVTMPERIAITKKKPDETVLTNAVIESEGWIMSFSRGDDEQVSAYRAAADLFSLIVTTPESTPPTHMRDGKITATGLRINSDFAGFIKMMELAGGDPDPVKVFRTLELLFEFEMESLTVDADIPRENGSTERVVFQAKTGQTYIGFGGRDSRMNMEARVDDFDLAITKPMPMKVGYGSVSFDFGLPTEASPEPQDIRYKIEVEDIDVSEQLWMLVDPGKQFPHELNRAVIDFDLKAIFKDSLFDRTVQKRLQAGPDNMPFQPTTITMNEIAFDAFGLKVESKGEVDLTGSKPAGKGFASITGLSEFLAALKKRRFIVDAQAIMIEGMARQMGKEGPGGALTYDIKTTDSMIVINDAPIAPLPPLPTR